MRSLEGSAQGGKRLCRQQVCATAVGLTRAAEVRRRVGHLRGHIDVTSKVAHSSADLPRLFHGKLCSTASRWCAMTPVQGKSWHQSSSKSVFSSRNQCSHPEISVLIPKSVFSSRG